MNKTFIISFFCIFVSCNNKSIIDPNYGTPAELNRIEMNIGIDENTLNSYNILSPLFYNGKDYIFANNFRTHAIDIINITDYKISHIILESEGGANGISKEISGLYASSLDSIWIATMTNISLIDSDGQVIKRYSLLERDSETALIMCNFSNCTSKIYYNKIRNSLFYLIMTVHDNKSTFFVEELSLLDNTKNKYHIHFNTDRDLRNDYGWKQCPNVTFTDSKILYNLPVESNIYVIDIKSGENRFYGGKSKFTNNEVGKLSLPYDFQQANRHISENVHFFEVNHDPIKDVYYRLHFGSITFDATQDFESLLNKKELYLTVFNNEFEIINETRLDAQKYNFRNCWGITNKGLFMTRGNMFYDDINYEQFQIDIFNII